MKNLTIITTALTGLAAMLPNTAAAEIKKQDDNGFLVEHITEVKASPDEIWKRLIKPKEWWNKAHSWSGSVDGFYIDAQAGGCFCELIKEKQDDGKDKLRGSVQHMRVIFADPGKVLRMDGALGPLQSEAVLGTLTVAMEPQKEKEGVTKISFNYIVGGYMRFKVSEIAPAVDGVIGEQFRGLLKPFEEVGAEEKAADGFKLDLDILKPAEEGAAEEESNSTSEAEKGR